MKCIVCGSIKDIVEFFCDRVCVECFAVADKYGRLRKVMRACLLKDRGEYESNRSD